MNLLSINRSLLLGVEGVGVEVHNRSSNFRIRL